jgi:D-lactate dehydrogenase
VYLCVYQTVEAVLPSSDIVSLHLPLTPATYHLMNDRTLHMMKQVRPVMPRGLIRPQDRLKLPVLVPVAGVPVWQGAMLINTSRGALVDTKAVIAALKTQRLGALGIDVYEEEENTFFHDLSGAVIQGDQLTRLLTLPTVLTTPHQGQSPHHPVDNS